MGRKKEDDVTKKVKCKAKEPSHARHGRSMKGRVIMRGHARVHHDSFTNIGCGRHITKDSARSDWLGWDAGWGISNGAGGRLS